MSTADAKKDHSLEKAYCPYIACGREIPNKYGVAGVSLSRFDNHTLICSSCGMGEALLPFAVQKELQQRGKFQPSLKLTRLEDVAIRGTEP